MVKINELIANDLQSKMDAKNVTVYGFVKEHSDVCTSPTLKSILRGVIKKLSFIVPIYKALGESEININTTNFKLYCKL